MLEKGHSLIRVEMLNWGNFTGYQQAVFREQVNLGPLFSPPPASTILGVNGSGKSTLIDGIMIALLPFDNLLKLGVTNDYEKGASGGRSMTDYVLGKFASTTGKENKNLSNVYNRESGCSVLQLCLQNNHSTESYISAGLIWWYSNYQIQDRLLYITQKNMRIEDYCGTSMNLPRNGKKFKESLLAKYPSAQPFDTAQAYFSTLSTLLGGITKEDLKIFNRAFYVKSIENIDHFVRENMLVEEPNQNLELLLENVASGNEITLQIVKCREKIQESEKILHEFSLLQKVLEKLSGLTLERSFLRLFQQWYPVKKNEEETVIAQRQIEKLEEQLPCVQNHEKHLALQIDALSAALATSETAHSLQLWQQDLDNKEVFLRTAQVSRSKLENLFKRARLSFPAKAKVVEIFSTLKACLSALIEEIRKESENNASLTEDLALLKQQAVPLRKEIEHLTAHKTLIDPGLYQIKTAALTELKIPKNNLMFVGELLSVKDISLRTAAEAALEPISKSLLVHPDYLDLFTLWLNKNNLGKSITVKRLMTSDIKAATALRSSNEDSILSALEIRSAKEHAFFGYLASWLNHSFDFQVVDVKEFKKGNAFLVTREGLVKRDTSTMRKLSKNLRPCLGWNPEERIALLANELAQLLHAITTKEATTKKQMAETDQKKLLLNSLSEYKTIQDLEFINIEPVQEQIKDLQTQIANLKKKDKKHNEQKDQLDNFKQSLTAAQNERAGLFSELERTRRVLKELQGQHAELSQIYQRSRHLEFLLRMETVEKITQKLNDDRMSLIKNQDELLERIESKEKTLEAQKMSSIGAVNRTLTQYQQRFGDPQLVYQLREVTALSAVSQDWQTHKDRLVGTELAGLEGQWKLFFSDYLVKSIKDTLNEIKSQRAEIESNIQSINDVLKLNHFEKLPTENRFLEIHSETSSDSRVRVFRRSCVEIENLLASPALRAQLENASTEVLAPLEKFVNELKDDPKVREFVTDVRNHFEFEVRSWSQKEDSNEIELAETFTGSRNDAKSSAQTTQLAYTLLASSLAYRFKFNDPIAGQNTPRMIILDEFGGKFDNEKPRDIIKMLGQMGFQSLLVSPMTKAELLADSVNTINLVHKASASKSKVQHYMIQSKDDYDRLIRSMGKEQAT